MNLKISVSACEKCGEMTLLIDGKPVKGDYLLQNVDKEGHKGMNAEWSVDLQTMEATL